MIARVRGFTLVELLIAVAIFLFLIMLAGPSLMTFMGSSQIRNATDAMLNGVQQAQAAAINRNAPVCLIVDPATGWQIVENTVDCPEVPAPDPAPTNPIQVYSLQDGAPKATVDPEPRDGGKGKLVFDGFGRIVDKLGDGTAYTPMTCIKVAHSSLTSARKLNVAISSTGLSVGTKICDPNSDLPVGDPMTCPAQCKT